MIRLLLLVLITFLGIAVGFNFVGTDSQVIVIANGWSIETNINVAVCFIIVFYALLQFGEWAVLKTLTMWRRTRHWLGWRKEHTAQQKTFDGVMAFMAGNYAQAEELSVNYVDYSKRPLVNYLTAINAANTQGKHEQRDDYLKQALLNNKSDVTLLALKLQFMISDNALNQAKSWVDEQSKTVKEHHYILPLRLTLAQQLTDWDDVIAISDLLLKKKIHSAAEHEVVMKQCYKEMLNSSVVNGFDVLKKANKSLPKAYRNNLEVFCHYARLSIKLDQGKLIEKELFQRLSKDYSDKIVSVITDCKAAHAPAWLDRLVALTQYHQHVEVINAIVALAKQDRQWKVAKEWLLKSIVIKPAADSYENLAKIQQELGEKSGALESFNKALSLRVV